MARSTTGDAFAGERRPHGQHLGSTGAGGRTPAPDARAASLGQGGPAGAAPACLHPHVLLRRRRLQQWHAGHVRHDLRRQYRLHQHVPLRHELPVRPRRRDLQRSIWSSDLNRRHVYEQLGLRRRGDLCAGRVRLGDVHKRHLHRQHGLLGSKRLPDRRLHGHRLHHVRLWLRRCYLRLLQPRGRHRQ